MGETFPHSRRSKLGYRPEDVDAFLQRARHAYDSSTPAGELDAQAIRTAAFGMQKGGYSTVHVDAALERLEDAFALRERTHAVRASGDRAWFGDARSVAQEVLERIARSDRERFARSGRFVLGYHADEVDAFCERLQQYFRSGTPMSVDEVRTVAFRQKRNGYLEWQVDLLLDAVVQVMLAVR